MTGTDYPATVAALRRCCCKCVAAGDGRGRAGAVREARNSLQHAGHDAAAALEMAQAMARVAESIAWRSVHAVMDARGAP